MIEIKFAPGYKRENTKYFVVHHAGGLATAPLASSIDFTADRINSAHKDRWEFRSSLGLYGGYNFYIDKLGKITQFRAVGEETAAQKGYNFDGFAISVCLAGNFTKIPGTNNMVDTPTEAQKTALRWLGGQFSYISVWNIIPHRGLQTTECYGLGLSDAWAREVIQYTMPTPAPVEPQSETGNEEEIQELLKVQLSLMQLLFEIYAKLLDLVRSSKKPLSGVHLDDFELNVRG